MYDAMISYSRKDSAFVRQLYDRLKSTERHIWVDWDEIPKTADWWQEIRSGIDSADAIIFIISPDSVTSEVCGWELEHAVASKKRLIPLMHRPVTEPEHKQRMHGALSSHNWLFFQPTDDFEQAFRELIAALETDLDHVKTHTRLMTHAKEWDAGGREASALLRGNDLIQAEAWLKASAGKNPQPAPLHQQYLAESRRVAIRRQRVMQAVSAFVLIVLVLTGIAVWQAMVANQERSKAIDARQDAEVARDEAEVARDEAHSLSLASSSQVALSNNNTDLAIALGLEANRGGYRLETERALAMAAYQPGTREILLEIPGKIHDVQVLPDGAGVVVAGCQISSNGICDIPYLEHHDLNTGEIIHAFDFGADAQDEIIRASLSPDGNKLLTVGAEVIYWDVASGERLFTLAGHSNLVQAAAISPDGTTAVTGDLDGGIIWWDLATGETLATYESTAGIQDIAFVPGYAPDVIAYGTAEGIIDLRDLVSGEIIDSVGDFFGIVTAIEASPDGAYLVWGYDTGYINIWDIYSGFTFRFIEHRSPITSLAISADSQMVLSASSDARILYWQLATQQQLAQLDGHRQRLEGLTFLPGSQTALSGSLDGSIRLWDLASASAGVGSIEETVIYGLLPVPESEEVIALTATTIHRFNAITGETTYEVSQDRYYSAGVLSGDELAVISCDLNCTQYDLDILDASSGESLRQIRQQGGIPFYLAFSPDGQWLGAIYHEGRLDIWNANTGELAQTLDDPQLAPLTTLIFAPDTLYTASGSTIFAWEIVSGRLLHRFTETPSEVTDLALSADGKWLASGQSNGDILIWDVSSEPTIIRVLEGHQAGVSSLTFNVAGDKLVSGSDDLTVRFWEVLAGMEIRRYTGHSALISEVFFGKDEQTLISGGWDQTVRVWRYDTRDDLVAWVQQNRYIPTLSCMERELYDVVPLCDAPE